MLRSFARWTAPLILGVSVLSLAACGISPQPSASTLSDVLGDTLPGARGWTVADQDKIDSTLARACAAGAYSKDLCRLHTTTTHNHRKTLTGAAPNS